MKQKMHRNNHVKRRGAMTQKELKEARIEDLIAGIYYLGIVMSGGRQLRKDEKELLMHCKELERRGIVEDAEKLYTAMSQ